MFGAAALGVVEGLGVVVEVFFGPGGLELAFVRATGRGTSGCGGRAGVRAWGKVQHTIRSISIS